MFNKIKSFLFSLSLLPVMVTQNIELTLRSFRISVAEPVSGFVRIVWRYVLNNLIALDQMANALVFGDPDMTISGRMGRAIRLGKCKLCKPICKVLEVLGKNHCAKQDVKESDEGKDQITGT